MYRPNAARKEGSCARAVCTLTIEGAARLQADRSFVLWTAVCGVVLLHRICPGFVVSRVLPAVGVTHGCGVVCLLPHITVVMKRGRPAGV